MTAPGGEPSPQAPYTGAPFPVTRISQVAMVVRDLDAAVRHYWHRLGIGPWRIMTFEPPDVRDMTYRGKRQDYRMRIALATCGDLQLELIESLEGPNIYEEFLAAHGEGMHHLGVFVDDLDAAVREMEARGYAMIQSGRTGIRGDGGFAYFETEDPLATTLELIKLPSERKAPDAIYPPE